MRDCCGYAFICRSGYFAFPFVIHIENAPTQQTIKHATGILLRVRVRAFVTFEYQNWRLVAPTQTGGEGISKLGISFFNRWGQAWWGWVTAVRVQSIRLMEACSLVPMAHTS